MRCVFFYIVLLMIVACDSPGRLQFLNTPSRVKIYTAKATPDENCESLLKRHQRNEPVGVLVSDSLADLESEGFANIQINHLPASKKMFVILVVSDPESGTITAFGCVENVEVTKSTSLDLPIILSAPTHGDDN